MPFCLNKRCLAFFKPRIKNVINRFEFLVILSFILALKVFKFFPKLWIILHSIGRLSFFDFKLFGKEDATIKTPKLLGEV